MALDLNLMWQKRLQLRAESDKLWAESDKLSIESDKLRDEGFKLREEGNKLWDEAIIANKGNIKSQWYWRPEKNDYACELNGEIYEP